MFKITILHNEPQDFSLENSGFSILIQENQKKILLDFSNQRELDKNLRRTGLNIDSIDCFVLSHGHLDHIEGIKDLRLKKRKPLIMHPLAIIPKFYKNMSIGFRPDLLKSLEMFNVEFSSILKPITSSISFLGEIPPYFEFEGKKFGTTSFGKDLLLDDSGLAIKTKKGLVLITGCGHSGICNMIKYAEKIFKTKAVAIIGGFHLLDMEKTLKTVEFLKTKNLQIFYGHCIDDFAKKELRKIGGIHFKSLQEIRFE